MHLHDEHRSRTRSAVAGEKATIVEAMVLQGFPCFTQSVSHAQARLDAVSTAIVVVKDLQEPCMKKEKKILAGGARFASGTCGNHTM